MDYNYFLETKTADKWHQIGLKRRSGVAVPLFSIYSNNSTGIGEFGDLKLLVKWCLKTGMSLIQLLPLNDVSSDFSPYNSVSSFALDPIYLTIGKMKNVNLTSFKKTLRDLKKSYPTGNNKVNYEIKKAKISILREIYAKSYAKGIKQFEIFKDRNLFWLKDYALFKVLKEINNGESWENWEENLKNRDEVLLKRTEEEFSDKLEFIYWIQWQLFEQFLLFKKYAKKNGVLIIGDLPFLVSRDSADVWSHNNYYDLSYSAGAPPDMYFANGQRWGMPPYNLEEIEKDAYTFVNDKLRYAENFYDMYRIDHFIGFFRIWSIDINSDYSEAGLNGKYVPADEINWEDHGKKILDEMLKYSKMMPVAEDLGTVPECSNKVLKEYGIPGINVLRWVKDENQVYTDPAKYRINSIATLSTHDSSITVEWWKKEAGTVDDKLFGRLSLAKNISIEKYESVKKVLFDFSKSTDGRLLWNDNIDTVDKFLEVFGFGYDFNWDLIKLYKESFGERRKYLKFINYENMYGYKPDKEFQYKSLKKVVESSSIFAVNLLQEWLMLDEKFLAKYQNESCRINTPGVMNDSNWRFAIPYNLEYMLDIGINEKINKLNTEAERS